jgi:hypothetical protein
MAAQTSAALQQNGGVKTCAKLLRMLKGNRDLKRLQAAFI